MNPSQLQELSSDDLFDALQIKLRSLDLQSSTSIQHFTSRITALQNEAKKAISVDRNVRGLLNELTMEHFDSISDQIITWANKAETEQDGRTLYQVIRLVFDKAIDEVTSSEVHARLCRKMMEQIRNKVKDHNLKNDQGKPMAGGQLFRKYLLNLCQEEFERSWVRKEATITAAEPNKTGNSEKYALYSGEYYAAMPKVKRRGVCVVKFIGWLFKLQMLTERIMHENIQTLLANVDCPSEEEIEGLCTLLITVGSLLDTRNSRARLDICFSRMKELTKNPNVAPHLQFMLIDLIELRDRKWQPQNKAAVFPITVAQEAVPKEKGFQEQEYYQHHMNVSSWGGDGRDGAEGGTDIWAFGGAVADGGSINLHRPKKAGDPSSGSHGDVVSTWQGLFRMTKGTDTSIQQHASGIRDIAERLTLLGDKPSDNILVAVLMLSLPYSYSNFVESLNLHRSANNPKLNEFDSVVKRCMDEEARQVAS